MKEKTNNLIIEVGDLVRALTHEFVGTKWVVKAKVNERYIYAIRVRDMELDTSPTYEFQEFELEVVESGYEVRIDRCKKLKKILE